MNYLKKKFYSVIKVLILKLIFIGRVLPASGRSLLGALFAWSRKGSELVAKAPTRQAPHARLIQMAAATKLCLLLLLVSSCNSATDAPQKESRVTTLPYYQEATFTPNWLEADSDVLKDFHQISPFQLTNQEGQSITEQTFAGKIYIADFFFTSCPGICPKMTANMAVLQDAFLEDADILLLSHSVTPGRDSVPILKSYAEDKGVDSRKWHLVTGDQHQIYSLGRNDYFVEEDLGLEKEVDDFLHTENFVLIDKNRHIRGIYNGLNKTDIEQLIADVRTLQGE